MLTISLAVLAAILIGALAWLYTPDKPRAALELEYAAPPSTFVEVLGDRIHLRDTGPRTASALILLHGFGASLHTWDAWAKLLDSDFRVIRIDLPGFGLTGPDPSGDYSDTRFMAILTGLMDQLGLPKATIIGHSMGGRLAWRFAADHPERVEKLVLMAPDGFASPGLEYGIPPKLPLLMQVLPYVLPMPLLRATLAPAYGNKAAMTDAVVEAYRDMMLAPGVRRAILARMAQTVLVDPAPLLRRIQAPTLLLWGEQDAMVPHSNAADYLRDLPHAQLVSFPGLGHLTQEDAPAETVAALRRFLAP
jgi:pimeloyl-ACP methyl ester carboxylesterase